MRLFVTKAIPSKSPTKRTMGLQVAIDIFLEIVGLQVVLVFVYQGRVRPARKDALKGRGFWQCGV